MLEFVVALVLTLSGFAVLLYLVGTAVSFEYEHDQNEQASQSARWGYRDWEEH